MYVAHRIAHPIWVVLTLTLLFDILILYGRVPLDFGKGIIIPLVKNPDGDKTSCDNKTTHKHFRCCV